MAISSPNTQNKNPLSPQKNKASLPSPFKRPKSPNVPIVRGRIFNPENGQTCHQCRQRTMNLVASCRNVGKKPCTIRFCYKCLLNRYGEEAKEMARLGDWKCPRCRGICNCSRCMKKRGQRPTGMLVRAPKATGFYSVKEMLQLKGQDGLAVKKNLKDPCTSPNKLTVSSKDLVDLKRKRAKENSPVGNSNIQCKPSSVDEYAKLESKKIGSKKLRADNHNSNESKGTCKDYGLKKKELQTHISKKATVDVTKNEKKKDEIVGVLPAVDDVEEVFDANNIGANEAKSLQIHKFRKVKENVKTSCEDVNADAMLPKGNDLVSVAGIELPADDIGPALQFLEFCSAFQQVLHLKKGQAESVLRELNRGRVTRRGSYSAIIQFHVKLLSLILKDIGEVSPLSYSTSIGSSWLQVLGRCISESQNAPKLLPLICLSRGLDGYDKLGSSEKLRILNFLCDETLVTKKMRSYIDEQHTKYAESKREAKDKVLAAKEKEKMMKQKLKDDGAQVMLSSRKDAPLSISEHGNLVSKIKTETEKAHAEMLEAMDMVSKTIEKQRLEAVRTEPTLLEGNGRVYWKLRGHSFRSHILLQEIENWDLVTPQDKWFIYDNEHEKVVDKHISTIREKRHGAHNLTPLHW